MLVEVEAKLVQCNVRMPQSAIDEYDAWSKEQNEAAGYEKHSRSDIMRDILLKALAERKAAKKAPKRKAGT